MINKIHFVIILIFSIIIGLYIHFNYFNKLSKYNKLQFRYYALVLTILIGVISRILYKNDKEVKKT